MTQSLYEFFGTIPDSRHTSGLRHPLQSFLTMTTLGIMSGYNAYKELATFFKGNQEEFIELFNLKHGVPSYTQTRTILQTLDYESLSLAFHSWASQYVPLKKGDWVSGDGKALNSTVTDCHNSKQTYVAMVSLFAQKTGTVFAVKRYENGKIGEGPSLREMLQTFEYKGLIITLDALHCQKKTTVDISDSGNDYNIQVKGNQPKLYEQIQVNVANNDPIDTHFSTEKNRGRTENRLVEIYDDLSGISPEWVNLKRIIHVHRYGHRPDTGEFNKHNYFILSCPIDDAKIMAQAIRGHWGIENRLHYVKDVVQNEDNSNIKGGFAIENLSLLKNAVINMFRLNGFPSIKTANITFANKIKELFALISSEYIRKN